MHRMTDIGAGQQVFDRAGRDGLGDQPTEHLGGLVQGLRALETFNGFDRQRHGATLPPRTPRYATVFNVRGGSMIAAVPDCRHASREAGRGPPVDLDRRSSAEPGARSGEGGCPAAGAEATREEGTARRPRIEPARSTSTDE